MVRHENICVSVVKQLNEMKSKIDRLENKTYQVNANIIQTTNIQNNFVLKTFGHESLDHLPDTFLHHCFANKGEGMTTLIREIHFDKECPENHNVRLKSTKQELMEVYDQGRWVISDQDKVLTDLIQNGYRVLRFHGRRKKKDLMDHEELEEDEFNDIADWLEKVYEDKREQKPIKRELLLLFLNNRPVLLGRDY